MEPVLMEGWEGEGWEWEGWERGKGRATGLSAIKGMVPPTCHTFEARDELGRFLLRVMASCEG